MEEGDIKSFLTIIQATILTVLITTVYFILVTLKNYNITIGFFLDGFVIMSLFYFSLTSLIFSAIFYYLYKNASMLLYLVLFFFSFLALLFHLAKFWRKKVRQQNT
ncbi:hypothetical protein SAMN05444397_107147 [Flavobacterium aquidurense]|uniref:Uncharacterized protein n=1 Tax=Flavobacterium frigidimaris TaxID=262320 RepID=A0ABX4BW41_FLAFR|nr:hypothetical protein B0A65_00610 [Flavobacterium frigidimaris]SDZ47260.1 hypothetical protein SAMN05444397_107147 [Flavobacterium aquidurense]